MNKIIGFNIQYLFLRPFQIRPFPRVGTAKDQNQVLIICIGWKFNLDGLISTHVPGNPTIDLSWPRCSGEVTLSDLVIE